MTHCCGKDNSNSSFNNSLFSIFPSYTISTSNNNQTEPSSDQPHWLVHIEQTIEEKRDKFASESPYYEIIRDLLLTPEDNSNTVSQAVGRFYDLYTAGAEDEFRKPPEYLAGHKVNTIAGIAFETAPNVLFITYQHDRLAELLIGIKEEAADEYNTEDPRFVYYGWGLETAASENWNAGHVDTSTQKFATVPESTWTESWINIAALLAKIFKGGLLDADGPRWIANDFERAFESNTPGDVTSDIGRQAQVLAPVNYILIAGEAFAKEAKTPSQKWHFELNANKWRLWASKLREVADAVDRNAKWDLKERAQKAYDKMAELYPEAFKDE